MDNRYLLYGHDKRVRYTVIISVLASFILALFIFTAVNTAGPFIYIFIIIFGLNLIGLLSLYLTTVSINEDGIFFSGLVKRCNMQWADVKKVGLVPDTNNKLTPYIYFSANNVKITGLMQILYQERISNELIAVEYRKEIMDVVKTYWHKQIENLDMFPNLC
jgi:hypothetical protein